MRQDAAASAGTAFEFWEERREEAEGMALRPSWDGSVAAGVDPVAGVLAHITMVLAGATTRSQHYCNRHQRQDNLLFHQSS